jgi:hypothetical protein
LSLLFRPGKAEKVLVVAALAQLACVASFVHDALSMATYPSQVLPFAAAVQATLAPQVFPSVVVQAVQEQLDGAAGHSTVVPPYPVAVGCLNTADEVNTEEEFNPVGAR